MSRFLSLWLVELVLSIWPMETDGKLCPRVTHLIPTCARFCPKGPRSRDGQTCFALVLALSYFVEAQMWYGVGILPEIAVEGAEMGNREQRSPL